MALVVMNASTDAPYPQALSDVGAQMNYNFALRFNKAGLQASGGTVGKLSISSSDPAQLHVGGAHKLMKVAPVIGFVRTGKMDTPVNVVLTGYQWSFDKATWIEMNYWLEQIPANVGRYVIPFAPTYGRFVPDFWTYFRIALEHTYSAEGISVDQWSTFVEFTGYGY